jgi:hypothetical protein
MAKHFIGTTTISCPSRGYNTVFALEQDGTWWTCRVSLSAEYKPLITQWEGTDEELLVG